MKKRIIIPKLFLCLFLASCLPGTQPAPPATYIPLPEPSPVPVILSATQIMYLNPNLGIQFIYPETWHLQELPSSTDVWGKPTQIQAISLTSFDPAHPPHKLEWTEQTARMQFRVLPLAMQPASLDDWVSGTKQAAVTNHLEVSAEEQFLIANQPARRLTLVSGSGGIIQQVLTILNERSYEIIIEGNYDLAKVILDTVEPVLSGGLKPPDSDTPAAGICGEPQENPVNILLGKDPSGLPLAGRCIAINTTQRIKLINQSNGPIGIKFAEYNFNLASGEEILLDKPVGEYLAVGVHFLPMGPELWVKTASVPPAASMPPMTDLFIQ